jgi:hypothetical protein
MEKYSAALERYFNREWKAALDGFNGALAAKPDDVASNVFMERCAIHMTSEPPEDWDGSFEMTHK